MPTEELRRINGQVNEIQKAVSGMQGDIKVLGERDKNFMNLLNRSISSNEELGKTMNNVVLTMNSINNSLETQNQDLKEVKAELNVLRDSSTINVLEILKDNWIKILLTGGLAFTMIKQFFL